MLQAGLVELIQPEGVAPPKPSAAPTAPAVKRSQVTKLIEFFTRR